ncbi:protein FAR-RED IMPAIRED RESPONSE 1-like [Chenopodium quinoa]|uniref:protein FAR-RED IMPAIRED RESPONSE 1-like n=1 Tax=Chenopodium quinoa TaxID=63459 RepID=UPI000B777A11|nr:protein FAR-RED IMPAIRED RESPONSE 1-like [Chenopodium quinoa]
MRNRVEDILGVDLAEAIREDGEDGHGCARELRFDSEMVGFETVGDDSEDDVYVYDEGLGSEDGFTKWDEEEEVEENEMGEGDDGENQGSDYESVHGGENLGSDYESVHGENVVDGEGFTTPKKGRQMVQTVFGVEEEIPPPILGMVFSSWDELDTYFWSYARQKGFGIVRAASGWVKVKKELGTGKYCKQRRNAKWTCDCYGRPSRKRKVDPLKEGLIQDEETVVQRKTKKCGCEVELYASVNAEGNWVVCRVNLDHTGHPVTPGKSKDFSMYRKHDLVNGVDQLTFTQKDLTNAVAEEEKKRLELTEGDANGMIEYFNKMSADNQKNFHLCRFGKDGSLQDVVWVDARSRAAYEEFGDVFCFDSTYLTNKFHLPFAVFLGVNHHGQSILFGCALISRETAETYEWVMRTWLHCMGGKAPTAILTDQDPTIRKVVHCTMAKTTHGWCIWHILQKFGKYVKRDDDYEVLKGDFDSLIYGSLDADEFEARWCDAIQHYELQDNAWLEG